MNPRHNNETLFNSNNSTIPHSKPIDIMMAVEEKPTPQPQDEIYIGSPPRETWLGNKVAFTGKPSHGYRQLLFSPKAPHNSPVTATNALCNELKHGL